MGKGESQKGRWSSPYSKGKGEHSRSWGPALSTHTDMSKGLSKAKDVTKGLSDKGHHKGKDKDKHSRSWGRVLLSTHTDTSKGLSKGKDVPKGLSKDMQVGTAQSSTTFTVAAYLEPHPVTGEYRVDKNLIQELRQRLSLGEGDRLHVEIPEEEQPADATASPAAPAVVGIATQGDSTAPAFLGTATEGGISRIAPMARWPTPSDDEEEEEIVHPWSRRSRTTLR